MRILTKPKVYLLARPQIVKEGLDSFLADSGLTWPTPTDGVCDAAIVTEVAGRSCYMSFGNKAGSRTNQDYINNLLGINPDGSFKDGPAHGSVLEHVNWTFIVAGAGRGFTHEQIRHRAGWAYSQLSTRYCDFEREEEAGTWEPGFTIPPLAQLSNGTKDAMEASLRQAQKEYVSLLHLIENDLSGNEKLQDELRKFSEQDRKRIIRKAARGAARDILPTATEAIMVMTANARAIWNCIYLRASEHAEAEIRDVYVQLAKIMKVEFPQVFGSIKFNNMWDGSEIAILTRDKL